jgi:tetratricopeptide (TPR) repeat protein
VIENVVISGRMGMAAFIENGGRFIMSVDRKFDVREARFGEWRDIERHAEISSLLKTVGKLTKQELADALGVATHRHDAFSGVLDGMNSELSEETRGLCIEEAEELLVDEAAATFVRNLLLGCPLPVEAALSDALRLAESVGAVRAAALYRRLADCADSIDRLWNEWRATAADKGLSGDEAAFAQAHFIERGVFRGIVEGLHDGDVARAAADATMRAGSDRDLKSLVPNAPLLLAALSGRLRQTAARPEGSMTAETATGKKAGKARKHRDAERNRDDADVDSPLSVDAVAAAIERGLAMKSRRPKTGGARMQLQDVQRSVDYIGGLIGAGRSDSALTEIAKLADQQLRDGEATHFVKSLCSLATKAQECGQVEFALRLNGYARSLPVSDPVVFASHGEILRALGRLDDALAAYDAAVARFPNDAVAPNGRAETLREHGRLEEALAAYDAAVERFPDNAVARMGRAETLRELGRLEEALAAYDAAVERFPDNAVARNGRAETLRALGRLEEALAAYDAAVERFPDNVVARNGRAETLRALGRLEEALAAYDAAVERFPDNVVARNGCAETLRDLGRLEEALSAYDGAVERFPNDVVARNGRAETLRELGRLEDALSAYDGAVERFPDNAVARNGRAETLRDLGRLDDALSAYDAAIERFPNDAVARNGRAETLRELGRLDDALSAYDAAVERFPDNAVARTGRAETLRELGRLDDALAAYDGAIERFPNNAYAQRGKAAILVQLSRFAEARGMLPTAPPKTSGDWIAAHIVAMSYLREGDVAAAVSRLRHGLENCPFNASRPYFATALAVAELRLGQAKEAANILRIDAYFSAARKINVARNLLRCHAAALDGDRGEASRWAHANDNIFMLLSERRLQGDIVRLFGLDGAPPPFGAERDTLAETVFIEECELKIAA